MHVTPGFSAFLSNIVESSWRVADVLNGITKRALTNSMSVSVMRACKTWAHDHRLAQVGHAPSGLLLHQPSLLRGSGLLEPKTCLYDKQFRRFTLERIQAGITAGKDFMVEGGVRGAFVSTWVMPKHDFAAFNQSSMDLYLNLMFATDVARVHDVFPTQATML